MNVNEAGAQAIARMVAERYRNSYPGLSEYTRPETLDAWALGGMSMTLAMLILHHRETAEKIIPDIVRDLDTVFGVQSVTETHKRRGAL